jgi:hypothetical protein
MKMTKFTKAQIAFILKSAEDGAVVAEVCRKAGISDECILWTASWFPHRQGIINTIASAKPGITPIHERRHGLQSIGQLNHHNDLRAPSPYSEENRQRSS